METTNLHLYVQLYDKHFITVAYIGSGNNFKYISQV